MLLSRLLGTRSKVRLSNDREEGNDGGKQFQDNRPWKPPSMGSDLFEKQYSSSWGPFSWNLHEALELGGCLCYSSSCLLTARIKGPRKLIPTPEVILSASLFYTYGSATRLLGTSLALLTLTARFAGPDRAKEFLLSTLTGSPILSGEKETGVE